MGSQSLEIIRSFLASFCGGFMFDPHSGVFCNAVHLYLWLFLLCLPFVAYLYFPTTFSTWVVYTIVATCVITVLKIINIALHSMYDKARTMSETNLKKNKIPREVSCDDEPGIEMQILGTVVETPPVELSSRTSVDDVHDEISCANSAISCDYQEIITSTIDLKADVHRKNSSESSDSIGLYTKNQIHSSVIQTHAAEVCSTANHRCSISARSELNKQKSTDCASTVIDLGGSGDSISVVKNLDDVENCDAVAPHSITSTGSVSKRTASTRRGQYKSMKTKRNSINNSSNSSNNSNKLQRQISLDSEKIGMGAIYINESGPCLQLQRHLSSEDHHSHQNKSNTSLFQGHYHRNASHHHHHHHHLHNHHCLDATDLYLENNYTTKSALQLAIENNVPEEDTLHHHHSTTSNNTSSSAYKTFLSQQNVTPTIRRDSNSTMSALQLPTGVSGASSIINVLVKSAASSSKLRRHSNTSGGVGGSGGNVRPLPRSLTSVRRIKSAALEICCPPASVTNLSPHPNSVETIGGQSIRNPPQTVLPPPSKFLSRNPPISLYSTSKGSGQLTFGEQNAVVVYPIAEQSDENASVSGKNFDETIRFERSTDSEYDSGSGSGNDDDSSSHAQQQHTQHSQQQQRNNPHSLRKHNTTSDSDTDDDEKYDDLDVDLDLEALPSLSPAPQQHHHMQMTTNTTTDSDTENNGSRSPLLEIRQRVPAVIVEQNQNERKKEKTGKTEKVQQPLSPLNLEPNSSPECTATNPTVGAGGGVVGVGPLSDWEQASASSKDMLITKEKSTSQENWFEFFQSQHNPEEDGGQQTLDGQDEMDENYECRRAHFRVDREMSEPPSQQTTAVRNLGAIPKTRNRSLRRLQSMGGTPGTVSNCEDFVPIRTYARGTSQRANSARSDHHRVPVASVATTTGSAPLITFLNYRSEVPMPPIYLPGSSSLMEQQATPNNFTTLRPASSNYHQIQSRLRITRYAQLARAAAAAANNQGQLGTNNPGIDEFVIGGYESDLMHHNHHQFEMPLSGVGGPVLRCTDSRNGLNDSDSIATTNFLVDEHGNWMQYTINKNLLDERRMIMDNGGVSNGNDQQRCVRVQYSLSSGPSAIDEVVVGGTRLSSAGAGAIFGNNDSQHKSRKSYYKFPVRLFGIEKELKISMTRLQLLALFDRDMNWFQVLLAVFLAIFVSVLGSIILHLRFYEDLYAFIFCFVIAGSQYSLLKSVQPDAASPIHGFNKTVTYSRPIYFCLCCCALLCVHELSKEYKSQQDSDIPLPVAIFGYPILMYEMFETFKYLLSAVILFFPLIFCLGLFPQINTFLIYLLEHLDMHVFGGNATCSLLASFVSIIRSVLACLLLYGPVFGALGEPKGSQHILFSMFCALLVPVAYHLSRTASDVTYVWALIKSSLIFHFDDDEKEAAVPTTDSIKEQSYAAVPRDSNKSTSTNSSSSSSSSSCNVNNSVEQIKMTTIVNSRNMKLSSTTINDDDEEEKQQQQGGSSAGIDENTEATSNNLDAGTSNTAVDNLDDPLPKKLQHTVTSRLKNDLVVCPVLAIIIFSLHCSTIFTVLQPDINYVLYIVAVLIGFLLHYMIPQLRKHLPWLCVARPVLKQQEYGQFEVKYLSKVMWFERTYVCLCFFERNILYPLIFLSALTADASIIAKKFGLPFGTLIIVICGLKCLRSAYSDQSSQYLILIFTVLFFRLDFKLASETFLIDYFLVSIIFKKVCELLLKLQFVVTYIAPWQITWGSAFHAFAQPFSVPHSAMLFLQSAISALLSTPLNPFLGSAIFLTSYVRPIKFWERDYNTRRIDHSNTRLSSQLERDLGADDNNLNSIFYEHLTRSLQHSLCGDLMMGRWGNVSQGDCFVLASDYLNCLVHIIELGNGLCTFQMRGLEFRGTYCQQREVEAISEGVEENDGCCCCSPGHLPRMLSANAMFTTRWLAWQVIASQYVLEGYSISDNSAIATLQVFEYRKVLISYYVKSIIYYTIRSPKLMQWLQSSAIQEALENTLDRQFVDLDPVFNHNLDDDYDFRAAGITRHSFCSVYLEWIQFCCSKRQQPTPSDNRNSNNNNNNTRANTGTTPSPRSSSNPTPSPRGTIQQQPQPTSSMPPPPAPTSTNLPSTHSATTKPNITVNNNSSNNNNNNTNNNESNNKDLPHTANPINCSKESVLVSLCLGLALLARRTLATASHSSSSGVEFFLHGLHALFKGDFRITSTRDEWVFADMDLLHGVIAPAVRMSLKLHQDHFLSPDEYEQFDALYDAIDSHTKELVISHEADPLWRNAVLRGTPNLLALRHVMEDGSDEYRVIRLSKRYLSFRVIKLNRECVRGLWAGQQQELIYLRNRNPERGSIQNAKQALRNIINSSCDQPIGYPIYVSQLTTSYADTNEQICSVIGGEITLEKIQNMVLSSWDRVRKRCREGCSSGSSGLVDGELGDVQSVYCGSAPGTVPTPQNTLSGMAGTISYGSQSISLSGTGNRGSLASINKPTSSTLLAGLLNRERESERETIRERNLKRAANNNNNNNNANNPNNNNNKHPKRESFREQHSNNSSLKQQESMESASGVGLGAGGSGPGPFKSNNSSTMNLNSNISSSSIQLQQQHHQHHQSLANTLMVGGSGIIFGNLQATSAAPTMFECRRESVDGKDTNDPEDALLMSPTIGINKKVIIVDANQIYDCLDLGRRIDVIWPNEQFRASGGRSSWKEWQPCEGMVGYVVHYWQPNHSESHFRSNVNRTILLLKIGDRFVPVGERGVKEYNILPIVATPTNPNTSLTSLQEQSPSETTTTVGDDIIDEHDMDDVEVISIHSDNSKGEPEEDIAEPEDGNAVESINDQVEKSEEQKDLDETYCKGFQ